MEDVVELQKQMAFSCSVGHFRCSPTYIYVFRTEEEEAEEVS
jgi:hypothetical protein